jgi:hypothetical protein
MLVGDGMSAYLSALIRIFRNHTVASPCLPWRPMRPLVGNSANGVLSQAGMAVPSGFFLPEVHYAMSMSAVSVALSQTLMDLPLAWRIMRFHSPGLRVI